MSISDRAQLFGDPTERLVAEAVWLHRKEEGYWPFWSDAVEYVARLGDCDDEEAEARLLGAVADDEVRPRIRAGGRAWGVELDENAADCITRRYMEWSMPRKETD